MNHPLDRIFKPKSVAIIGASSKESSIGHSILKNAIEFGYNGNVYAVNPKGDTILERQAYRTIGDVPEKVDLAVVAVRSGIVPTVVQQCGDAGVGGLVIISAGFKEAGPEGEALVQQILRISRTYGMRIVGPNCLGVINPSLGLNVSFANRMALPGHIAFISQSGALCSSILDWAESQQVGFSFFVSVGSMVDIGFAELIDYFGKDRATSSILIYMESITDARKFMSAARGFARSKPIIVLKAGRSSAGTQAALSHTGTLAGNDDAFDAAFKRAGCVRVEKIEQLFLCAQSLSMQPRPKGNRLAIVTNAGGPGVLCTDYLTTRGGELAKLPQNAIETISRDLSPHWSHGNPVDVLGDATPKQYRAALDACLCCESVNGALVVLTVQTTTDAAGTARELVEAGKTAHKPILACFMGESDVFEARRILEQGRIPNYLFPESAVDVFLHMWQYDRNLEMLYETPPETPAKFYRRRDAAWHIIRKALLNKRKFLLENEAKELLACYDLPIGASKVATSVQECTRFAEGLGFPVAMKVVSPDALHKTDVGGVRLNVSSRNDAEKAYREIIDSVKKNLPDAQILGVLIEKMYKKRYELLLGAKKDPIFGPLIVFGQGGIAVEVNRDTATGLPPLNIALARRMIQNTMIYDQLKGFRSIPGVDLNDLAFQLHKIAYLVTDFSEICEIDVNPYLVDENSGIIVDARIVLEEYHTRTKERPYQHLVVSPYPEKYIHKMQSKTGREVLLRPIRPEDEPMEAEMFTLLSDQSLLYRFMGYRPTVTHDFLTRLAQIDYDREMAIIAEIEEGGRKKMAGVVRIIADARLEGAEFAILIADKWQGQGLGSYMSDYMLEVARDKGIRKIFAYVLRTNVNMIQVLQHRGFVLTLDEDQTAFEAELDLENAMPFATELPFRPEY